MPPKKRAHLYKKGQSGNPKGRPARPKLPDNYTFQAAKIMIEEGFCPVKVLIELALYARSEKVRCDAAGKLLICVVPVIKPVDFQSEEAKETFKLVLANGQPVESLKQPITK